MTNPPSEAGGHERRAPATPAPAGSVETRPPQAAPLPAAPSRPEGRPRSGPAPGQRSLPQVRPSDAAVELTLDLRSTPPDKVLSRLFGALERVGADVVLLVLLRDTPEYVGAAASAFQALRTRCYVSDTSRMPGGGQCLVVRRRREQPRPTPPRDLEREPEPAYVPPPVDALAATLDAHGRGANGAVAGAHDARDPYETPSGTPSGGALERESQLGP